MKQLSDYIKVYDDILTKEECEHIIQKFENDKAHWEKPESDIYKFSQLNINKTPGWEKEIDLFSGLIFSGTSLYFQETGLPIVPDLQGFEEIRIKKYEPDSDERFDLHVDVANYNTARRFLVCFCYLSDNEEGQTEFPTLDLKIPCKQGSVLMFPPLWMFPHAGLMPIKTPKYILGTYLHYM